MAHVLKTVVWYHGHTFWEMFGIQHDLWNSLFLKAHVPQGGKLCLPVQIENELVEVSRQLRKSFIYCASVDNAIISIPGTVSGEEEILFLRSKTECRGRKRLHLADTFNQPLNSQNGHLTFQVFLRQYSKFHQGKKMSLWKQLLYPWMTINRLIGLGLVQLSSTLGSKFFYLIGHFEWFFHGNWSCMTYKSRERIFFKISLKEINKQKRIP